MATTRQVPTLLRHIRRLAAAQKLAHLSDRELLQRFAVERDEAAFAALVKRHGPMVLHVGQRVLHNGHDAEDIFQATFLVLTRKAGSLRWHESVGNWLYQAAYRIALKAKTSAARRGVKEARAARSTGGQAASATPPDDLSWREVETLLDEELHRLPVKYRVPLVFCYLEGSTRDEAAQQLGWSLSTLKRRLERGREMLRLRLVRRGLTFSAALFAPMLTQTTASTPAYTAALAPGLIQATVRSALQLAAGQPMAGLVSAPVAALVEGGLKTMLATKVKVATAVLLAVSVVTGAGALSHQALAGRLVSGPPGATGGLSASGLRKQSPVAFCIGTGGQAASGTQAAKETPKPPAANDKDSLTYSGRVLGPDGKPVAGAKLYMTLHWGYPHYPSPSPEHARTGPDGRFQFSVPKAKFLDQPTVVAAAAANHGTGWVEVPATGKRDDLTLRLVDDDGPITGQIVDLEGKPVPGATVSLMQINAAPGENLGPWLEAIKSKKDLDLQMEQQYLRRFTIAVPLQVATDAEGRFRLTGIGRNRLVRAQLDGPTIASEHLCVLTRPGEAIQVIEFEGQPEPGVPRHVTTYHGANFRHAAAPTKPIIGVVRDQNTKKPLAGVTVQSHTVKIGASVPEQFDLVRTTTDAQGRYRLTGMPKGKANAIISIPGSEQPYVASTRSVPDSPGLDPVTVDFELKRGVWIEGKITDKVTGKPLPASVEYFSLSSNPNLRDYEGFGGDSDSRIIPAKEDGSYRVVGVPGPGLVVVWNLDHYLRAGERDDEEGVNKTYLKEETAPYLLPLCNYSAFARINPAKGVDAVKQDVTLDPGWTFTGTVVGPDGQPLAGVRAFDLTDRGWRSGELKTAEFTVRAFNPRRPRDVFFQHLEMGLVGIVQPPKENGGSVTVRMEPGAAVTGRLIDADVQPRRNVELNVWFRIKNDSERRSEGYPYKIKTDGDGRFRIKALLPGYEFHLSDGKGELPLGDGLRSGQTKDLGDVQLKANEE